MPALVGLNATWLGGVFFLLLAADGRLSAPFAPGTPFRVFTEAPGPGAMTGLPWIMVPAILVPLLLFIHFVIRARSDRGGP